MINIPKGIIRYQHPGNGYVIIGSDAISWLMCLLFGPFYFLLKRNFVHAFIATCAAIVIGWPSWIIYPVFVYHINDHFYQSRGWIRIK